jgi:hypothetical protein
VPHPNYTFAAEYASSSSKPSSPRPRLLATAAPPAFFISEVWPNRGSIMGGTYVIIKGAGWTRGGAAGTTQALINGKPCVQSQGILQDSSDTNFACWSPAIYEGGDKGMRLDERNMERDVDVTVVITLEDGSVFRRTCANCFSYKIWVTPVVSFASLGGYEGSILKFSGGIRHPDSSDYWIRTGGDMTGGGVGGALCAVHGGLQPGSGDPGGPTHVTDNTYIYWYWGPYYGIILCQLPLGNATSEAGRYPVSFEPRDIYKARDRFGYGQPLWSVHAPQDPRALPGRGVAGGGVALASSIGFGVTLRPLIKSVSVTRLGLNGGARVTILGSGFSPSLDHNEVFLGESSTPCKVVAADPRSLECLTGPASSSSPAYAGGVWYPGGAGLLHTVWLGDTSGQFPTTYTPAQLASVRAWIDALSDAGSSWDDWESPDTLRNPTTRALKKLAVPARDPALPPTFATINADSIQSRFGYNGGSTVEFFAEELEGLFVPPVSANYTFYIRGDDMAAVWLSPDANASRLELIAIANEYTQNWWSRYPFATISNKIYAEAGVPRYFKVLHREGQGGDFFDLAIRVHTERGANKAVVDTLMSDAQKASRSAWSVYDLIYVGDAGQFVLEFDFGSGRVYRSNPVTAADTDTGRFQAAVMYTTPFLDVKSGWLSGDDARGFPVPLATGGNSMRLWAAEWSSSSKEGRWRLAMHGPDVGSLRDVRIVLNGTLDDGAPATRFTVTLAGNASAASWRSKVVEDGFGSDPFYWPAPMDFFRTALPLPAVQVRSNGLLGVCNHFPALDQNGVNTQMNYFSAGSEGRFRPVDFTGATPASLFGCSAVYSGSITPTVTNVDSSSAAGADLTFGTVLTITGTNFLSRADGVANTPGALNLTDADLASVTLVGNASVGGNMTEVSGACNVTASSPNAIVCSMDEIPAGNYTLLRVNVNRGRGLATFPVSFKFSGIIGGISPAAGSRAGGTVVFITGSGFLRDRANNVTIGGQPCTVLGATFTNITCVTPPLNDTSLTTPQAIAQGADIALPVVVNGRALSGGGASFTYRAALTPLVDTMTPSVLSSAVTGRITFNVSNVPLAAAAAQSGGNITVAFGPRSCLVLSVETVATSDAVATVRIVCLLIRKETAPMPQLPTVPTVHVAGVGNAALDAAAAAPAGGWALETAYRVGSVSPQVGSLAGGTRLTVTGYGFTGKRSSMFVSLHVPNTLYAGAQPFVTDCAIETVAADGTSLTCLLSRPDYESSAVLAGKRDSEGSVAGKIVVTTNRVETICEGDAAGACTYTMTEAATPRVTAADFSDALVGGTATLTGLRLDAPLNVWLGTRKATIRSSTSTSVTFNVPAQPAGLTSLFLHSGAHGSAEGAWNFTYANPFQVTSLSTDDPSGPLVGTGQGGQTLIFVGKGFSDNVKRNAVSFGDGTGTAGSVVSVNSDGTELRVIVPGMASGATTVSLSVWDAALKTIVATSAAYNYSVTTTNMPFVNSVSASPSPPQPGVSVLTIAGTNFGSKNGTVSIGDTQCTVTSWSASLVKCTLGSTTPAGTHVALVSVPGAGLGQGGVTMTITPTISSVSRRTVGAGGGVSVTLTGTGFATTGTSAVNVVAVCGVKAKVLSSNSTSITFESPPLPTVAANDAFNTYQEARLDPATFSGPAAAYDGDEATLFTSCQIDLDMGPFRRALVTRVRFFPSTRYYNTFGNSRFLAANDTASTASWTTLHNVPDEAKILDGWNYADTQFASAYPLGSSPSVRLHRYVRWRSVKTAWCDAYELDFIGKTFVTPDAAGCPVTVTVTTPAGRVGASTPAVTSAVATAAGRINVTLAATPAVLSISPDVGSALGGQVVTITGVGFDSGVERVSFNGMPATVQSFTATTITVVTGPRTSILPVSVDVFITDRGRALVNETSTTFYSYLDKWSDLTTWQDNEPPGEGDTVVVPRGQAVLVDVSPPKLFLVLVQGHMRFDDSKPELAFDAHYITVLGGRFEIGSHARPYLNKVTVTLHGHRDTAVEIPGFGAKCLGVMPAMDEMFSQMTAAAVASDPGAAADLARVGAMVAVMGSAFGQSVGSLNPYLAGSDSAMASMDPLDQLLAMASAPSPGKAFPEAIKGNIEIHGAPRQRVWTFGNASAPAGSRTLLLSEDVDWQVGEVLAISPTGTNSSHAERNVIAARNGPRNFTLAEPLKYTHDCFIYSGGEYGFTDTRICFEAGLLSRNVVIQGDESSPDEQFGMHSIAAMGAVFRAENAEWRNCGQSLIVGRYCMHVHLVGTEGANSYAIGNSVHDSFQRAVTVHASNNVLVQNNVAFRVMAHTFFVEDGVELYNTFDSNLVIDQLTSAGPIRSDALAACFWTASPANRWTNNVCAGSVANGWWFQPPPAPTGPSATNRIVPYKLPLGAFQNNTVHSSGIGLFLWLVLAPILCDPTVPQTLRNNTFWRNGNAIFLGNSAPSVSYIGTKLIENSGGIWWHHMCENAYTDKPMLEHTLVVASTDPATIPATRTGLLMPLEDYTFVKNITFVNFGPNNQAVSGCADNGCLCGPPKLLGSPASLSDRKVGGNAGSSAFGFTHRFAGLRFVNSPSRVLWDRNDILVDLDGSLTNSTPGTTVAPYHPYLDWAECPRDVTGAFSFGILCRPSSPLRLVTLFQTKPDNQGGPGASTLSLSGGSTLGIWANANFTEASLPPKFLVVSGRYYGVQFTSAQDWTSFSVQYSDPNYLTTTGPQNEYSGLTFTWSVASKRISILGYYPSVEGTCAAFPDPCPGQSLLPWVKKNQIPGPSYPDTFAFGTGNVPSGPQNNTWTVLLNKIVPGGDNAYNATALFAPKALTMDVTFSLCPPTGCSVVPPSGNLGAPITWSLWESAPTTPGQDFVVGPSDYIILDVSPPPFALLTIYGRLEVFDKAGGAEIVLSADNILVFGSLAVGTPEKPLTRKATVVLTGNRDTANPVVDSSTNLGNKGIIVYGNATIVGQQAIFSWTRLASPAAAGDTTLTLAQPVLAAGSLVAWAAGQSVVITETEWSSSNQSLTQVELADIASVSADGLTLTLARPLRFAHYAGRLSNNPNSPAYGRRVAAAVGLLSRNVVVRGDVTNSPSYGGRIFVSRIRTGGVVNPTVRRGSLIVRHAELRDMGQEGMGWAAIDFRFAATDAPVPASELRGVVIRRSFSAGVTVKGVANFPVVNCTIYSTRENGIYFDKNSPAPVIRGNLIAGNYLSPATYGSGRDTMDVVYGQAGVNMGLPPAVLERNYVSGMFDTAFVIPGEDCANAASPYMADNEAAGVMTGVNVLPRGTPSRCILVTGFTVWKAAHMGIYPSSIRNNDIRVTNSVLADNHMAFFPFLSHYGTTPISALLQNVTIVGTSPASATCAQSSLCRTVGNWNKFGTMCDSAVGPSSRRVGVVIPIINNDAKTKTFESENTWIGQTDWFGCALKWDERFGVAAGPFYRFAMDRVTFSGFNDTECGGSLASAAITLHPGEVDGSVPVFGSNVVWDGIPATARFRLPPGNVRPLITDSDGTLLESGPGATLLGVGAETVAETLCRADARYRGAVLCPGNLSLPFRNAMLQSIDAIQGTDANVLGPTTITRYSADGDRAVVHTVDQGHGCSLVSFFLQPNINFIVRPGTATRIQMRSTEPVQTRLFLNSPNPSEKVIVHLFLTRPNSQAVFVDGVRVPSISDANPEIPAVSLALPTLSDPIGTSLYRSDLKILYVVLAGGYRYIDVIRQPSVMLSFAVSTKPGEQIQAAPIVNSLAALLGINPSRIRVVDVKPLGGRILGAANATNNSSSGSGSSSLSIEILDDKPVVPAQPVMPSSLGDATSVASTDASVIDVNATTASGGAPTPTPAPSSAVNAAQATLNSTLTQIAAFDQQSRMVALGAQIQQLATSGAIVEALAVSANLTVGTIDVTPPQVSVAAPNITALADIVASAGLNVSLPSPSPTATPTASPTPSTTASASQTPSTTVTASGTATVTPSPTATLSPGASPSGTPTPSTTVPASPTPSTTVTASGTASVTSSPTATLSPGASPSGSPSGTLTPSITPTRSAAASPSSSPAPPTRVELNITFSNVDAATITSPATLQQLADAVKASSPSLSSTTVAVDAVLDRATGAVLYQAASTPSMPRQRRLSLTSVIVRVRALFTTAAAATSFSSTLSTSAPAFLQAVISSLATSSPATFAGSTISGVSIAGAPNAQPYQSAVVVAPGGGGGGGSVSSGEDGSSLTTGAIIGVVIGVIGGGLFLGLAALLAARFYRKHLGDSSGGKTLVIVDGRAVAAKGPLVATALSSKVTAAASNSNEAAGAPDGPIGRMNPMYASGSRRAAAARTASGASVDSTEGGTGAAAPLPLRVHDTTFEPTPVGKTVSGSTSV